ncbi:MAG: PAS domain-containing sensor histidine kinase [Candidatus Bathyarchaeota archaeon]|nr:PAS domain-containing sensor histidine kinase [Candidatus Bathyarchaeota archaeon]
MSKSTSNHLIKVLYLDDNSDRVKVTKRILKKIDPNLDLVSVKSIEEELDELSANNYDCILTNYNISKDEWNNIGEMNGNFETPIVLFHSLVSSDRLAEVATPNEFDALDKRLNEYQVLADHIQDIVEKHKEKLQVNESERKLRSILDNMLEGCQVIDPDFRYVYLNRVAVMHSQKTLDELLGKTMMECYPGIENTAVWPKLTKCLRDRVPQSMENLFTYPDGSQAWFELRFEPVPAGVFLLSIDISAKKHAEERLRESERQLAEERIKAENAVRFKALMTEFIRNATHEIRTPLTSISGYLDLIQTDVCVPDPKFEQYLQIIERNAQRLERLTSTLLDIQRIDAGRIDLELSEFNVFSLIDNVVNEIDPILKQSNQRITLTGEDAQIKADHTRLMQVLVNLIMNASRFSPDSSEIGITVDVSESDVTLSVTDHGVGISEEDILKLFTPFPGIYVEGISGGNGLGLSICKGIVELHGGNIWGESEGLGKGSTFTFQIPRNIE